MLIKGLNKFDTVHVSTMHVSIKQYCKFSTKNGQYKPYIVNADAKKYPYLSINKGLMIWDDYFTIKTVSYML
ncbi:MAG TPA: hypothetical protein DHV27_07220 [Psychrobacter sp.]|nr:hypothetical protein [Psychrobacter sp.]